MNYLLYSLCINYVIHCLRFESVFDPSTSQKLIYEKQVKPLLEHTVNGRNASVFAYGPTGAGECLHSLYNAVKSAKEKL